MGGILLFFFYGSILFCVIASIVRMTKYVRAPLHLRWELHRGSSVYELTDWWKRSPGYFGEKLRGVFLDILFLREFYHRNRSFWFFLFLFHIGFYLIILWHLWLFLTALTLPYESALFQSGSIGGIVFGYVATGLSLIGGSGVLIERMVDGELKSYYPRIHYLKWFLILLILTGGLLAVVSHFHSNTPELLRYVKVQVTFQDMEHKLHPALTPASHVFFVSFWLLYLPFSHILQIFFRYYHYLRWDDVPNRKGSTIERKVKGLLDRPISWAAPHIQSGKKWGEVVSPHPSSLPSETVSQWAEGETGPDNRIPKL
jgi:nitrate reductase gamma subunit